MVKRDFAANPDIDVDAPRSKRRKDTQSEAPADEDNEMPEAGASSDQEQESGVAENGPAMSPEEVREEGHKVLQVLKDAVDKDGRSLSYDFLRLPSKRQFPDYYLVIKRPIALDDIKTQLDNYAYPSLEAVRQDFEQCFKNAKKYNMRESVIWKDAKALQKIANKEIEKIVRRRTDDDDADGEAGSDKEGGRKKEKGVNINRLMKNRLQKLTSKTDVNGRLIAADFMDLPSKKKWAVYYKIIKRPICIEDIFKRIKRKEYPTIPDFISDVDLVFANAMQFNEEHSPIWEDAVELKVYFHQLMTDLPAKYNMNGAGDADPTASPEVASNKILLKLPHHQAAVHAQGGTDEGLQNTDTAGGTVRLRVPAL
ncbi:Bromodomain-containing protein, partial [Phellopilus nigrolimitatus]